MVLSVVVDVPVSSVVLVDSLVGSLLGVVSFGSFVVKVVSFLVVVVFVLVVVVVVWVTGLEYRYKCYELVVL